MVIAFLVLHAVAPPRVGADDIVGFGLFDALDGAIFQHRLKHLQHRLVLVDARIGALAQQAKPGLQADLVAVMATDLAHPCKTDGVALAMALARIAIGIQKVNHHVKGAAQNVFGVNFLVF